MSAAIRAFIVDDEPAARDAIRTLLATDPDITILGEAADGRTALEAVQAEGPDLLFLDIQMPEMDGFTLLRNLSPEDLPVVVFVTAFDQYALRAFDFHALDYLLKPFDDQRFFDSVRRAKERVRQGRLGALSTQMLELLSAANPATPRRENGYPQKLAIRTSGSITLLPVEEIDWLEADGDHVCLHAGRASHQMRDTLQHVEGLLDPQRFVRVHRSAIVNVDRIRELQPYYRGEYVVVLKDGARVKLSRGRKPHLEQALGRQF